MGKTCYKATSEVRRWIGAFDRGKAVKPITIEFVPYKFGETHHYGKYYDEKKQPIIICGEARMAGADNGPVPQSKKQLHADAEHLAAFIGKKG